MLPSRVAGNTSSNISTHRNRIFCYISRVLCNNNNIPNAKEIIAPILDGSCSCKRYLWSALHFVQTECARVLSLLALSPMMIFLLLLRLLVVPQPLCHPQATTPPLLTQAGLLLPPHHHIRVSCNSACNTGGITAWYSRSVFVGSLSKSVVRSLSLLCQDQFFVLNYKISIKCESSVTHVGEYKLNIGNQSLPRDLPTHLEINTVKISAPRRVLFQLEYNFCLVSMCSHLSRRVGVGDT